MPARSATVVMLTHRGLLRPHNEDMIAINDWVMGGTMDGPQSVSLPLAGGLVLLVCDGMGGHQAGEIASTLAVRDMTAMLTGAPDTPKAAAALQSANTAIYRAAAHNAAYSAMGTTAAGLWLDQDQLVWFNVGDSCAFRYSNDFLVRLSVLDALDGPRSGVVTQALGGTPTPMPIDPHTGSVPVTDGTRYLVCSDGLTDMVSLSAIEDVLAQEPDPVRAVARLFEAACRGGAHDNVSIILATVETGGDEPAEGEGPIA